MSTSLPTYAETMQGLRQEAQAGKPRLGRTMLMLVARMALFAFFQGLAVLVLTLAGRANALDASAAWWPVTLMLSAMVNLALLVWLYRAEGRRYMDLLRIDRANLKRDLLALLGILIVTGPVAFIPNYALGTALFGDMQIALNMLVRPLPVWGLVLAIGVFPIVHALTELPTYFGYVMPRLEAVSRRAWLAVLLPVLFLSFQHIFVPFIPDARFITWRAFMFLPFALMMGLVMRWRPHLLPFLVIFHALMDAAIFVTG